MPNKNKAANLTPQVGNSTSDAPFPDKSFVDAQTSPTTTVPNDSASQNSPPNVFSTQATPQSQAPPEALVTAPHTPKKYGGKKVIATIFGILLLIGGVAAGVGLVQRVQDIRERAASGRECSQSPDCILLDEPGNSGEFTAPRQISHAFITDRDVYRYEPGETDDGCRRVTIRDNFISWEKYTTSPSCKDVSNVQIWMREKVNDMNPGCHGLVTCEGWSFFFNHQLDSVASVNVTVDDQVVGSGQIGPSSEQTNTLTGTWITRPEEGKSVVFKVNYLGKEHQRIVTMVTCPISPTPTTKASPTPSPPPTPTLPPEISAQCLDIKVYDTDWNLLSSEELANLSQGNVIRFAAAGSANLGYFDKARFTINGLQRPEVTTQKPGTNEFYDEYTIPEGVTTFTVNAQIHHSELGWF